MNFQFFMEKLQDSKEFREFKDSNPGAYPCSGFFIFDFEHPKEPQDKQHIDYYVPSLDKIFSFKLENGVEKIAVEKFDDAAPSRISADYDFDFEDIKKIVHKKMEEEKSKNIVQKMIFSLQGLKSEDYLVGTIFISGFGLIKIHIKISDMSVTLFEKRSFFDMIKISGKNKKE